VRIARIVGPSGPEFAVQGADGSWITVESLGVTAATTAEVVAAAAALSAAAGERRGGITDPQFLSPIVAPGKIVAVGLNYADHMRETNQEPPVSPRIFGKFTTSISGPYDDIVADERLTQQLDYEAELVAVIGKRTKHVSEADALDSVFGYLVGNDVSARDAMKIDGQLDRAKSFDTYCPLGPWITTADEVADPQSLGIRTRVNGETRQDSSTAEMYFSTAYLIHFLARGMTFEPGDVIMTGTPHGVGFAMKPPHYLVPGDVVECEVEGLGTLRNRVVAPTD
jgi:2-keto-4-pentenoate hydratase/2-oxohepta-3-ene-1,7-dioic acid hydratase in catechol pathway